MFWGMRLFAQSSPTLTSAVAIGDGLLAHADVSRLLGSSVAIETPESSANLTPDAAARFRLSGIMAPKHAGEQGLAVISVDGNPARVYRVGAAIEGDLMLREVSLRTATVASARNSNDSGTYLVLEMPLITAAATGVLPQAGDGSMPQQGFGGAGAGRDAISALEPPAAGRLKRGPLTR